MEPLVKHPGSYAEKVLRWWRLTDSGTMPRHPLILLISGWAGSGKDAAAALLAEELGFYRCAFANSLKADVSERTGIPVVNFHFPSLKNAPLEVPCGLFPDAVTHRDILLQHAEAERAKNPSVFCARTADLIASSQSSRVAISDWRLLHEHAYMKQRFPSARIITMRISRYCVGPRPELIEHELDEFPFDIRIANDGCISDLRDALRHALRPYLG